MAPTSSTPRPPRSLRSSRTREGWFASGARCESMLAANYISDNKFSHQKTSNLPTHIYIYILRTSSRRGAEPVRAVSQPIVAEAALALEAAARIGRCPNIHCPPPPRIVPQGLLISPTRPGIFLTPPPLLPVASLLGAAKAPRCHGAGAAVVPPPLLGWSPCGEARGRHAARAVVREDACVGGAGG